MTRVDEEGGERFHRSPSIVPGRGVLFEILMAGDRTESQIAHLDLDTGTVTRLGLEGAHPRYASTGHLLVGGPGQAVRAVPFDPDSLGVSGRAVTLVEGLAARQAAVE